MHAPRKFDPANWQRLLSPERRALLDPGAFLDLIAVAPGSTVADIGAGPGFFTAPLAERVGPTGRVIALDVSPAMVERLREQPLPPHVDVRVSREHSLPVDPGTVDVALLAFVLHELEDAPRLLADVRRILAPAGRLVVLEWVPRDEPMGPPRHERISASDAARALTRSGFVVAQQGSVNPSNYFLVAR